ncbi:MAG TPA: endonuclease III [Phycisphaerae bacterium]|nr:endonuclease III [Phycisphaerae bacterium]
MPKLKKKLAKKVIAKKRRPVAAKRPPAKRTRENATARTARAVRILAELRELYPQATTALQHNSALELLVATILSAQCTDERVNMVTPNLFRRYPTAAAFADAEPAELEAMIRSTGFFRNKTKSLIGTGRVLRDEFGGCMPDTMDDLLKLPGVARKTANCVLGTWFGKNEGIVVDTHVGRLAVRLGLLTTARDDKDALKIENDLMTLFPQESWTYLAHALIQHGRRVCSARKPDCATCGLANDCPSAGKLN